MFPFSKKPDDPSVDVPAALGAESENLEASTTIPLIAEDLLVGKRTVSTGTVRLQKHTEERTETIDVPLTHVTYSVERVPVGRIVAEPPPMRQEGDTTIYPVIEERVVITRELHLREEVRVTRVQIVTNDRSTHTLLREEIAVERNKL